MYIRFGIIELVFFAKIPSNKAMQLYLIGTVAKSF